MIEKPCRVPNKDHFIKYVIDKKGNIYMHISSSLFVHVRDTVVLQVLLLLLLLNNINSLIY